MTAHTATGLDVRVVLDFGDLTTLKGKPRFVFLHT